MNRALALAPTHRCSECGREYWYSHPLTAEQRADCHGLIEWPIGMENALNAVWRLVERHAADDDDEPIESDIRTLPLTMLCRSTPRPSRSQLLAALFFARRWGMVDRWKTAARGLRGGPA